MTMLAWTPEYTTGIVAVDYEHRKLIQLINDLLCQLDESTGVQAIEETLGEIHSGIAAHFALEENLMRKAGYDEYEAHKDDHEELLDQVVNFVQQFTDDPELGRELLQKKLSSWFSVHFSTFDARLHNRLGPDHH